MLMLVLANNYALLFVGWEGVGLCSYLLIGFYFHKKSAEMRGSGVHREPRGRCGIRIGMLLMPIRNSEVLDVKRCCTASSIRDGTPASLHCCCFLMKLESQVPLPSRHRTRWSTPVSR
jgi:hypothetical protein